jgi:hypothetical protein
MVTFRNVPEIVALSIVLATTISSAAPAPSPEKALDNMNTNGIHLGHGSILRREEEAGIPIVGDLLGNLPVVGDLLRNIPIVVPLVAEGGGGSGGLLKGLLGGLRRQDDEDDGDGGDDLYVSS